MSYHVKPEDISEDTFDKLMEIYNDRFTLKTAFVAILNAAIEAGLVSPPCFCVRQNGDLCKFDSGETKVFSGKPWAHDTEHWKGQAE